MSWDLLTSSHGIPPERRNKPPERVIRETRSTNRIHVTTERLSFSIAGSLSQVTATGHLSLSSPDTRSHITVFLETLIS